MQDELNPENPVLRPERERSFVALLDIADPRIQLLIRFVTVCTRVAATSKRVSDLEAETGTAAVCVGVRHALTEAEAGEASVLRLMKNMYMGGAGPSEPAWDHYLQLVLV
jgi:hypothetical protein